MERRFNNEEVSQRDDREDVLKHGSLSVRSSQISEPHVIEVVK